MLRSILVALALVLLAGSGVLAQTPLSDGIARLDFSTVSPHASVHMARSPSSTFWDGRGPLYLGLAFFIGGQVADGLMTARHLETPGCVVVGRMCEWNPLARQVLYDGDGRFSRGRLVLFKTAVSIPTVIAAVRAYPKGHFWTTLILAGAGAANYGGAASNYCADHDCAALWRPKK